MRCTRIIAQSEEMRVSPRSSTPTRDPRSTTLIEPDALAFVRGRLGLEPDLPQAWMLSGRHPRLLVNCSRQWGKSTITAAKALHVALSAPETLVLIATPTARQSALFVQKVRQFVRKLGIRVRGDGDNGISVLLPNQSRIVGLPGASEDKIRGFSAASMLIVDEASRVDDAVYYAARPILAASGGDIWLLSTPRGKRGFFYAEWEHGNDRWERVSVPATDCARIHPDRLEEERATMGEDWFRQEFMCEFVDADGVIFRRDLIEAAFSPEVVLFGNTSHYFTRSREIFIGVDLGQKHDFTAISILEVVHPGPAHFLASWTTPPIGYHLRHLERVALGTPYPRVVERIAELTRLAAIAGRCTLVVDATGVGLPVVDLIRQANLDCDLVPLTITGGEHAHRGRDGCTVPKRDLLATLDLMLENRELQIAAKLPERSRLVEEMMSMRSNSSPAGKHDDLVLSLALACWRASRGSIGHQSNRLL